MNPTSVNAGSLIHQQMQGPPASTGIPYLLSLKYIDSIVVIPEQGPYISSENECLVMN